MTDHPDVEQLMQQIEQSAAQIEARPVTSERPYSAAQPGRYVPPNPELDENWDAWVPPRLASHRGLLGKPVVWLKKLSLKAFGPHDRELLRRQREFNRAAVDEIYRLRRAVADLSATVAQLKRERK